MFGTRYIILNSPEAVSGILEKQSIKCSDRPRKTMSFDLVGFGKTVTFMSYNDRFRQHRKLLYRLFGTRNSTAAFNSIEEEETRRFVRSVLQKPEGLVDHIRS